MTYQQLQTANLLPNSMERFKWLAGHHIKLSSDKV